MTKLTKSQRDIVEHIMRLAIGEGFGLGYAVHKGDLEIKDKTNPLKGLADDYPQKLMEAAGLI